jgi:hypothetical protein
MMPRTFGASKWRFEGVPVSAGADSHWRQVSRLAKSLGSHSHLAFFSAASDNICAVQGRLTFQISNLKFQI